ncbi:MAG: hypothetical protein LBP92_01430 [Deltaproteobacteria bacterium]|jgi:hypothetical protein|nr:hypothetical protein [Deltaproteobacteria bacterium]
MWRSKPVIFRQGRLELVSRDFYALSPIIRLKVDGEFFFASLLQFRNPDDSLETVGRLEALSLAEPGLEVCLGAHRLDDGSFWLHWLKCQGRPDLTPPPPGQAVDRARDKPLAWTGLLGLLPLPPGQAVDKAWHKLLAWTGLMVAALLVAALLILGTKTGGTVIVGSLFLCGAIFCGAIAFGSLAVLLNKASPEDKAARLGLESLEAALAEGHPWQTSGLGPAATDPPPEIPRNLPPGLSVSRVDHALVRRETVQRSTGQSPIIVDYLIYDFMADGKPVSWPVMDTTCWRSKMPAFRRAHPPFLAPGDEVLTLVRGDLGFFKRLGLPDIPHEPVLELFNLTDRSTCLSETDHRGALPQLYLLAVLTILSALALGGAVSFFSSVNEGFVQAALEALKFTGFILPIGFLTMGVIVMVAEAFIDSTDSVPEIVAGRRYWRLLSSSLKRKTALARPTCGLWQRFSPWRVWITMATILVSAIITTILLAKGG